MSPHDPAAGNGDKRSVSTDALETLRDDPQGPGIVAALAGAALLVSIGCLFGWLLWATLVQP